MAAPTPTRTVLAQVVPATFAQNTWDHYLTQLQKISEEMQGPVTLQIKQARVQDALLWRRAFAWAEFARQGITKYPELLDKFTPYDETSKIVHGAVQCRQQLARRKPVTVMQLHALAGVSKIYLGDMIREQQLPVIPGAVPYEFSPATAHDFLRTQQVAGFV